MKTRVPSSVQRRTTPEQVRIPENAALIRAYVWRQEVRIVLVLGGVPKRMAPIEFYVWTAKSDGVSRKTRIQLPASVSIRRKDQGLVVAHPVISNVVHK